MRLSQHRLSVVLVGFFPNDFKDNLHFRNWTQTGSDDYWTWMRQQRRSDLSDTLANYSILYRLIDAARRYGQRDTFEHHDEKLDFVFRADSWWKTVLDDPGATPGYRLSEEAFRSMAATARAAAAAARALGIGAMASSLDYRAAAYEQAARQPFAPVR